MAEITVSDIANFMGISVEQVIEKIEIKKRKESMVWTDKTGTIVNVESISDEELFREEIVSKIITKVEKAERLLQKLKESIYDDVYGYIDEMRAKRNINLLKNAKKGNLTLQSYSGSKKIQIVVPTNYQLNEKIVLAKDKIDEYLDSITADSSNALRIIVKKIFGNSNGIDVRLARSLRTWEIKDPLWMEAMGLIDEATEETSGKKYLNFYRRAGVEDDWEAISLNFAR